MGGLVDSPASAAGGFHVTATPTGQQAQTGLEATTRTQAVGSDGSLSAELSEAFRRSQWTRDDVRLAAEVITAVTMLALVYLEVRG